MGYTVRYYPDGVNQFNRLVRVSGSKGVGTYETGAAWDNLHYDPGAGHVTDYDNRNCTAAVVATLRDAMTIGRSRTSPNTIRNNQFDFAGGIGFDDGNTSLRKVFGPGEILWLPSEESWADVIAHLRQGRALGIQGDYDQVPWAYQAQKGGTFDHAFSLHDYRPSDSKVLLWDPLAKTMRWVPQSAIRGAAEKLAMAQRGTRLRLFVAVTDVLKSGTVVTNWRVSIHPTAPAKIRPFWRYLLKGDYIVDREAEKTGGFSSYCSAPFNAKVLSTKRDQFPQPAYRLVKIPEASPSAYHGWFVAAGYAEEV